MTTFGFLLLLTLTASLYVKYKYTFCILIVSMVFLGTTITDSVGKTVQPYLLSSLFIILRTFPIRQRTGKMPFEKLCVHYIMYAVLVTMTCPFLFSGIKTFDKNLDVSYAVGGYPLEFHINNITQLGYLFFNFLTLYCVWANRKRIKSSEVETIFLITVSVVVYIGFWEYFSKLTGKVPFPSELILNNKDSGGEMYLSTSYGVFRLSSVFPEASFCGAFLSASFWALVCMKGGGVYRKILCILTFFALVLNLSGTGIMGFLAGLIVFLISNNMLNFKRIMMMVVLSAILITIVVILDYGDLIYMMFFEKSDSESAEVRLAAVKVSINVFLETLMIGGGLGCTRSSSLAADMLAQVGIVGSILFSLIYWKIISPHKKTSEYIFMYALTLLGTQLVAVPDISFGCMWMILYIAVTTLKSNKKKKINYGKVCR